MKTNDEKIKLKVTNTALKAEKESLENEVKVTKKDLAETKETQKVKDIKAVNKKILDENYLLKANLEKVKSSQTEKQNELEETIEVKNKELKTLINTRKLSVEQLVRLQERNQKLEEELRDLKKFKAVHEKTEMPYLCDKCSCTFRTAGLLVKHVENQHPARKYACGQALVIP